MRHPLLAASALGAWLLAAGPAQAACGAAFCTVNTNWSTQGEWTGRGGRFDLRFEYIDQDQPRAGSDAVGVGEIPGHHDEVRTINRNWIALIDYNFNPTWGVSASLPLIDRDHTHIHNHHGAQLYETWQFTELGDARVSGRYRFASWDGGLASAGASLGVKLPTGSYDVANNAGDVAERSLQPGTGTTDALIGLFVNGSRPDGNGWFAQARWESALDSRQEYRPGDRIFADLGYRHGLGGRWTGYVQLNAVFRDRDRGDEAEPEDSGGTFLYVSPGVSVALGSRVQGMLFLQLPLYQYVNGVQLTADYAVTCGLGVRF